MLSETGYSNPAAPQAEETEDVLHLRMVLYSLVANRFLTP